MSEGREPETVEEHAGPTVPEAGERPAAEEGAPGAPAPEPSPEPSPSAAAPPGAEEAPRGAASSVVFVLALLLVLVIAGVAASPFWAPPLVRLLPWAPAVAGSNAALAARLAASETAEATMRADLAAVKSAQEAFRGQLARLASGKAGGASADALARLRAQLGKIEGKVQTLAAQAASRPAIDPARLDKMQQQIAQLSTLSAGLAVRLPAIEHQLHAQEGAEKSEAAMLTALLQMRDAVGRGQPFDDAYQAFAALARGRPGLLDAARPLAEVARDGVVDRATLKQRLDTLAQKFARAAAPLPAGDWKSQALRRLRSLVTIRRIGAPPGTPGGAAVKQAEADLARGDLTAAVAALGALSGDDAQRAQPWLTAARRRLGVEVALDQLQRRLLGDLAGAKAAPAPASAKPGAPS